MIDDDDIEPSPDTLSATEGLPDWMIEALEANLRGFARNMIRAIKHEGTTDMEMLTNASMIELWHQVIAFCDEREYGETSMLWLLTTLVGTYLKGKIVGHSAAVATKAAAQRIDEELQRFGEYATDVLDPRKRVN